MGLQSQLQSYHSTCSLLNLTVSLGGCLGSCVESIECLLFVFPIRFHSMEDWGDRGQILIVVP